MTALPELQIPSAVPTDPRAPAAVRSCDPTEDPVSLLSVFTLVLWVGVLGVSAFGLVYSYARPQPLRPTPAPVQAEIIRVELTSEPLPPLESASRLPDPLQPPPLPDQLQSPPPAPSIAAVADPVAAIAFPMPIEGPVRVVEPKQATYVRPESTALAAPAPAPPIQALTYGRGEGRQPAPDYPPQAMRQGQEGTVTVRFSVGENGRVFSAEASSPSPWPLLNQAAVRVVRERWRFRAGAVRLYEVAIRFELTK